MLNSIVQKLNAWSESRLYWLALVVISLAMLSTALFYQYVLEEWPCVLCIQVRLWLSLLLLVSVLAIIFIKQCLFRLFAELLVLGVGAGLIERSYLLLGTERGFVFRDCGFDLGLPGWLALDQWLPWLYRVDASCGYTPEILFGITMAESLMVFSIVLFVFALAMLLSSLLNFFKR